MKLPMIGIQSETFSSKKKEDIILKNKDSYSNIWSYLSPLGKIILASDGESLTGLWFEGQKYFPDFLDDSALADLSKSTSSTLIRVSEPLPIFRQTKEWLDLYFSGTYPDFMPPLNPQGSDFRKMIWQELLEIPPGQLTTYGAIGNKLAAQGKAKKGSAQAIG